MMIVVPIVIVIVRGIGIMPTNIIIIMLIIIIIIMDPEDSSVRSARRRHAPSWRADEGPRHAHPSSLLPPPAAILLRPALAQTAREKQKQQRSHPSDDKAGIIPTLDGPPTPLDPKQGKCFRARASHRRH